MCVLILGQMGAEIFLARFSLLIVLAGLTVLFLGWSFFRAILFPWAFLVLMIPIPAIVFNQITFPAATAGVEGGQHYVAGGWACQSCGG